MKKKLLIMLMLSSVLVTGCSKNLSDEGNNNETSDNSNTQETAQTTKNIYSFKDTGDRENYFCISGQGLDYMIPSLSDEWTTIGRNAETDCIVFTNSVNTSRFVIIRNTSLENRDDGGYDKKINGREISSYLEQQIAAHVGKNEQGSGELEYVNNLKIYSVSGRTEFNGTDYIYKGFYFQSCLFKPSVHSKNVPTGILIMYEDGNDTDNVLKMLEILKRNMVYDE